MQRAILVTAVFLMGALLGQNSAKRLSLRRDMLGDLIASIRRLSMRMEYARLPLHRMAEQCAGGTAAPVFAAFAAALEEGRTPLAAWETAEEHALLHERAFAALHPGDREVLRTFAGALGTADLRASSKTPQWRCRNWSGCRRRPARRTTGRDGSIGPWACSAARRWRSCCCDEVHMGVEVLFKIASVGVIAAIVAQLLKQSGRDEIATIAAIAGLIIGLLMMLDMIEALFDSVRQVFNLY